MSHLHSTFTTSNAIPPDLEALLAAIPIRWSQRDLHTHGCRDCQPNSAAVYRQKIERDFRNLHSVFVEYAYSLIFDRGWTFTAATETATMRQAAAKRVATEEAALDRERIVEEEIARARRGRAANTARLIREAREFEAAVNVEMNLVDGDLQDWNEEDWLGDETDDTGNDGEREGDEDATEMVPGE